MGPPDQVRGRDAGAALTVTDAAADVGEPHCVINPSADEPAVPTQSSTRADGSESPTSSPRCSCHPTGRDDRGSYVGCIADALSRTEYLDGLAEAGFVDAHVTFTHPAVPGMHAAIIGAIKPVSAG